MCVWCVALHDGEVDQYESTTYLTGVKMTETANFAFLIHFSRSGFHTTNTFHVSEVADQIIFFDCDFCWRRVA